MKLNVNFQGCQEKVIMYNIVQIEFNNCFLNWTCILQDTTNSKIHSEETKT